MKRGWWDLHALLRGAAEARHVAGNFLYGDPERQLHEALKVKPGIHRRSQNATGARVLGYLQRGTEHRE